MKKLISIALVIVSLFSMTSAFAATKEELIATINQARLELTQYYEPVAKGTVLYEDENVKITATSAPYISESWSEKILMDIVIENYTDVTILCWQSGITINGWVADGHTPDHVPPMKKAKTSLWWTNASEVEVSCAEDVQDIEGMLTIYNDDGNWDVICEIPFHWFFNN